MGRLARFAVFLWQRSSAGWRTFFFVIGSTFLILVMGVLGKVLGGKEGAINAMALTIFVGFVIGMLWLFNEPITEFRRMIATAWNDASSKDKE